MRVQQDQGTILARLQFELEAHIKDTARPLGDFFRLVMDPEKGAVVRIGRLEAAIEGIERRVTLNTLEVNKVGDLEERIAAIEQARREAAAARAEELRDRRDTRRWLWRDVIVAGIAAIVIAVAAAWATVTIVGG